MKKGFTLITTLLLFAGLCFGQEPTPPKEPAPTPNPEQQTPPSGRAPRPGASQPQPAATEPQPYEKVITKDAKTKTGIFTVHQLKEKYYYEIPKSELGKDFLWVSQFTRAASGTDRGGQLRGRVVRWERRNNKVFLRLATFDVVADPKEPIAKAVEASNTNPIVVAFNVEAWGKDEAPVIDVTKLFTTEVPELGGGRGNPDASRSYVEKISVFPTNIEVEVTNTYSGGGSATPTPTPAPPSPESRGAGRSSGGTYTIHYSMVKLPEKPMMARVADDRVGFFGFNQVDYGTNEHRAARREYIARWRLEKKDPSAAVSEPVKPIVYYVDPATPAKWVPYIKKAIENWKPAFEQAGFKNAIIAKEAPLDDPDWSTEDVRNTVIRWLPSTTENAMGPHVSDPRSGEILNGNISVYHNIMNLQRTWYFLQVGPLDPRAQKLPLPDDLMGRLIEYVVTHEIGHTLGLMHNFKASSMYTIEQIRDRNWVKKMGHCPSIMDYSRFNYVAQPEDKIDVEDLIPRIGPYDKWAIHWGYAPIPNATTPDAEKPTLDKWAREQDKTPYLRFAGDMAGMGGTDPGEETEAVGDADAVRATGLGVKNLERVANMLLTATTTEKGEPFDDLEELYNKMIGQWNTEMGHVLRIVGGIYVTNKHIGQEGVLYTPVPVERQKAAVKFLNENALVTPSFFMKPEILNRIEAQGSVSRITKVQSGILKGLLSPNRVSRMQEQMALHGNVVYAPADFLGDVRKGVFKELEVTGPVKVAVFRRNLQQSYVEIVGGQLKGETRPYFRGELISLSQTVKAAIARAADRETKLHLEDLKDQIAKQLDPKFAPPVPAAPGTGMPQRGVEQEACWPEYQIK